MNILLAGGAGYIGSHVALNLLAVGENVVILDNLSNSTSAIVDKLNRLTGIVAHFVKGDVRNQNTVKQVLKKYDIDVVVHMAALKSVAESMANPLHYYDNNVTGTIALCNAMVEVGVKRLIFSSSATVYGDPMYLPIDESHPLIPNSTYGLTKLQAEQILYDFSRAQQGSSVISLRYFNPVGAHESGVIGEDPLGSPTNIFPLLVRVALGRKSFFEVYGTDYETDDGTGIRDYIHVTDIAEAHKQAISLACKNSGFHAINLGAGRGFSVFQVIQEFEKVADVKISWQCAPRRKGDVAVSFADTTLAHSQLGWRATKTLQDMCVSALRHFTQSCS